MGCAAGSYKKLLGESGWNSCPKEVMGKGTHPCWPQPGLVRGLGCLSQNPGPFRVLCLDANGTSALGGPVFSVGLGGMGRAAICSVSHGSAGLEGCSMAQPSCPALSRVCVQLAGRWYSIGLASNSNWFKDKKHLMKMCTTDITVTADGNMEVTSTYPKGDHCEKRNSLYIRTEQPGRFSYTSPRWGSNHDIRVVETNYDEYALVATQISKSTGSSNMVLLYSRTKELAPQRLERFMQFSQEQGLKDEEILILPQTDKCMADAA
uniref:Prostaglandin-H2 D-isomerase n=1 Tax=Phasianus colchicus TaxID=9054 RepID=A0A669Q4X4_PHACC